MLSFPIFFYFYKKGFVSFIYGTSFITEAHEFASIYGWFLTNKIAATSLMNRCAMQSLLGFISWSIYIKLGVSLLNCKQWFFALFSLQLNSISDDCILSLHKKFSHASSRKKAKWCRFCSIPLYSMLCKSAVQIHCHAELFRCTLFKSKFSSRVFTDHRFICVLIGFRGQSEVI